MATGRVAQALHLEKADLIQATSEDIDYMPIVRSPLREVIVKLCPMLVTSARAHPNPHETNLERFLVILDIVSIDVVMRADRLPQLWANNHTRSFSRRATGKEHDPATSVLEGDLQETDGDGQGNAGATEVPMIAGNRPWVFLQLLKSLGQLEFGLLDREQKPSGGPHGHWATRLLLLRRHSRAERRLNERKHFLDLLCRIILISAEDIGPWAFVIADLVDLSLEQIR